MQTREDRIYAHYRSLKGKVCCPKHWYGMSYHVWMPLARAWKMPIREIKEVIAAKKINSTQLTKLT